jgi:hypothetical protein
MRRRAIVSRGALTSLALLFGAQVSSAGAQTISQPAGCIAGADCAAKSLTVSGGLTANSGLISGASLSSLNGVSVGSTVAWNNDTFIQRDAANTLALRNGASAQSFNVYNTYTDGANYERGELVWNGNQFFIGTTNAGTGAARGMVFKTANAGRWQIDGSGNFTAANDNSYDIGASGANRPRSVYVATSTISPSFFAGIGGTSGYYVTGRSGLLSGADGNWLMTNNAGTNFGLLQLGGTTSSFPALKRNGSGVDVRAADDTAYGNLNAQAITANASYVRTSALNVSGLSTCNAGLDGARESVSDSTVGMSGNFGAVVTGGGSNHVPVYCDGANWKIGRNSSWPSADRSGWLHSLG